MKGWKWLLLIPGTVVIMTNPPILKPSSGQAVVEPNYWMVFREGKEGEVAEDLWIGFEPDPGELPEGSVVVEFTKEMRQADMSRYFTYPDCKHFQLINGRAVLKGG